MLFKILRGPSSRISKDKTEFHDGYAYFTPDDGGFYIDAATESTDPDGAVQQKRIRVNPVMSVNGSTGDVILPTVFVVKLSGSGTTADPYVTDKTFDELNEAYDRGDICILRFDREAVEFALTYMYADLAYFNRLFLSGSKTMQEVSWDGNSGKIQVTTIDIRESLDQSVTGQEIPTAEAVWNAIPHPEAKTDAQTQSVGADSDGKLWTAPSPVTSVNNKTGAVTLSVSDVGAQPTVTTIGIIKGDGAGNLSAAVAGTDYAQDFVVQTVDLITSPATNKTVTLNKTNTEIITAINAGKNVVLLVGLGEGLVGVARLETRTGVNIQVFRGRFTNPGMVNVSAPIWYDFLGVLDSAEGSNVMHYSYYTVGSPGIPIPSTSDNGKFLQVVNGAWAAVEIANANGGSF